MKRLRIALVVPGITLSSTGPSVSVRELAHKLCLFGHEVTLATSDLTTGGGRADDLIKVDQRVNVEFFPAVSGMERRLYRSSAMKQWLHSGVGKFDLVDI